MENIKKYCRDHKLLVKTLLMFFVGGGFSILLIYLVVWDESLYKQCFKDWQTQFKKITGYKELLLPIVTAPILFVVWFFRVQHHDETVAAQNKTNQIAKENAENTLNHTKYETRYAELEKVKDILIKLKPLALDEHSNIICPNDAETVNDAILALARLTDFLQDEAKHMEPIRRMAFILLKQTWKSYVVGIAPEMRLESAKDNLANIRNVFIKDKMRAVLRMFSKTLIRGLLTKESPNQAKLNQEFCKDQLEDFWFIGLETSVEPNISLLIENMTLFHMDFSYSNLGNMIFRGVTLRCINFQGVFIDNMTFDKVNIENSFFSLLPRSSNIYVNNVVSFGNCTIYGGHIYLYPSDEVGNKEVNFYACIFDTAWIHSPVGHNNEKLININNLGDRETENAEKFVKFDYFSKPSLKKHK